MSTARALTAEEVQHLTDEHIPLTIEEIRLSYEAIEKAGFRGGGAVLVKKDHKERVRQWGNDLVQMACRSDRLDERLTMELRSITQALSHLLNSQSYADGKLYDFDKNTIDRKLGRKAP